MTDPGIAQDEWAQERRIDLAKTLALHLTLAQTMWLDGDGARPRRAQGTSQQPR
jgi:hypothetical protein